MANRSDRFMDWDWKAVVITPGDDVSLTPPTSQRVTEERLARTVIDEIFLAEGVGALPMEGKSEAARIRDQLAREVFEIQELGGTIEIPPGIAGEGEAETE